MRIASLVVALAFVAPPAFGQGAHLHGVELGDIDRSAAPCSDFFQFANGSWRAKNPIPDYMPRWSRRWAAGEKNKAALQEVLEAAARQSGAAKGSVEQQIGDFYAACIDEPRADRLGTQPLAPALAAIDAMKSRADLVHLIWRLQDEGVSVPFSLYANSDKHEPTQIVANLGASGLGLPDRDYYLKPDDRFKEARQKYHAHVAAMFVLFGADAAVGQEAADVVLRFETELARHSLDNVALRDPSVTDHKMTFAALAKLAPHLDWRPSFAAAQLPETDLNVDEPKFIAAVDHLIVKTPLPEWKIYLRWQRINDAAQLLSRPIVDENFAFAGKYLSGATEQKPRGKRCSEQADQLLGEALGKKYVEKYFPPAAKARMQELTKNVLGAMKQTIEGAQWMTAPTKQKALEKLGTFRVEIGYPDKWKDYSSIAITRDGYLQDWRAARQWAVAEDRARIGKPLDRGRWEMTPPTSDASYNPQLNTITFPAGILQPPAFDLAAVDAVNYGAIGVVIGHEVSHGFDDEGARFDAQGRLHNWWTDADLKQFEARGQCVADQFEGYFIEPGIHHQGKLVLGEAIGDLGGVKIAQLAFELAQKGKPAAKTLDGFTPEQQFFLAWGQFRGDATRPEQQRLMVQGDPHPIAKFRVIGPLSNLPAFQRAFACPANAAMVRPAPKRCEVW
jgi:putative endopeptidase